MPTMIDRIDLLSIAVEIDQERADAVFRASRFLDDLDDYGHDAEEYGHVYYLSDGRAVVIAWNTAGRLVAVAFDPASGEIDPEDAALIDP